MNLGAEAVSPNIEERKLDRRSPKDWVPRPVLLAKQYLSCVPQDFLDALLGRTEPLMPPTRLMFDGPRTRAEFKANGAEFLRYYVEFGKLKPDEHVLDVGCGIGRKTIPLTQYLNRAARYEGFDIVATGIRWCQKHISAPYPNFHFQWVDVYNKTYNPNGKCRPADFQFPFPDNCFDFAAVGSVFTHMLPRDMGHYLCEIARVLKPGGRCLITYFIFNDESSECIRAQKSTLGFEYQMEGYRTTSLSAPEDAVCFDELYILDLYRKYGLDIQPPIYYGSWCGRPEYSSYQDIVVAVKQAATQ